MNWSTANSFEHPASNLFAIILFLVFSALVLNLWRAPENSKSLLNSDLCLFIFGALSLVGFRWMGLPHNSPIQSDEVQAIVEARRFLAGDLPWKNVDTTTCGALSSLILAWPGLFGVVPNFLTTQATILAAATSILILPNAFKGLIDRKFIWTVCWLFWGFLCLIHHVYVFHFFNTYLPLAFLNLALWFGLSSTRRESGGFTLFLTGLLLGAIPYVKIQFSLSALVLFFILLTLVWSTKEKQRKRYAGILILGGLFVPALFTGFLFFIGAWDDFWNSYVVRATQYGEANPYLSEEYLRLTQFVGFDRGIFRNALITPAHSGFFAGTCMIVLIAITWGLRDFQKLKNEILAKKWLLTASFALLSAGIVAYDLSKLGANYYLFLLFTPFIILASTFLSCTDSRRLIPVFASGCIAFMLAHWLRDEYGPGGSPLANPLVEFARPHLDQQKKFIKQRIKAEERMAVWGYVPELYLDTNTLPATREAIGPMQILDNPQRPYFRHRFLVDLKESNPHYFIDGTGHGALIFENREKCGFENDPDLKKEIETNYRLIMDFTEDLAKPSFRIYENLKFDQRQ